MKLVNRSVLVLKPMAKMLDWIKSVGEESDTVTPGEAQKMTNAYLLPDFEDDEEQATYIRFRAKKLFEHELAAWCTDSGRWPSNRNYKAFTEWFRVEVSHMVYDLASDKIVRN
ncbi:MAG: VacJ [bacterium]